METRDKNKSEVSPNSWIFQGNPDRYDVIRAVTELDQIVWSARQYSGQIAEGDRAYIWMSGQGGGVVARGVILDSPKRRLLTDDKYTLKPGGDEYGMGVLIGITDRCTETPFSRPMMLADRRLKQAGVLTFPNATNYRLTPQESLLLDQYFEGCYQNTAPNNQAADPDLTETQLPRTRYWVYAPGDNACKWEEFYGQQIMGMGWDAIGDFTRYGSKEAMKEAMRQEIDPSKTFRNDGHATWQFTHDMQCGDVVFAKKGLYKIIGRGVITSEYLYDARRKDYRSYRRIQWTHKGEWDYPLGSCPQKTLTEVTPYTELVRRLNALFDTDDNQNSQPDVRAFPSYTMTDFLNDVFMTEEQYLELTDLLAAKQNIILQGPPGVGKTYAARRLAYSLVQAVDPNRVMTVQFHQSYSYEDFMLGYRPDGAGFSLSQGPFYQFCKEAEQDSPDTPYYFIIDEINRGNLSKIFGELLMLIEKDKRGQSLRPLYSDELFSVPKNVYIIGMMNTADRSLAIIDYALRRRFAFYELVPAFDSAGFLQKLKEAANPKLEAVVNVVKELNQAICADESLGPGFCIGHSYFCSNGPVKDQWVANVVKFELLPLLNEYWFDAPSKTSQWAALLKEALDG